MRKLDNKKLQMLFLFEADAESGRSTLTFSDHRLGHLCLPPKFQTTCPDMHSFADMSRHHVDEDKEGA